MIKPRRLSSSTSFPSIDESCVGRRNYYDFWHLIKRTIFAIVGGGRARDLDEEVGGRGVFHCYVALLRRRYLGILGNEEGGVGGRRSVPDGGGSSATTAPPVK